MTPTCVCANVSPQQPGSGEGLATGGTHTRQRVRPDVHLEGAQAGVLLGAVFAVEEGPSRGLSRRGKLVVGRLVVGQRRQAGVALGAVQTVVHGLDDIRAGGVRRAPAVLLFLAAAAGGRAAQVQGGRGGRREETRGDWGHGGRQGVHAAEERADGVAGEGGGVVLHWKIGPGEVFWDNSWQHRREKSYLNGQII